MPCQVVGCPKPKDTRLVRGYCETHYARFMRNGDPGPPEIGRNQSGAGSCEVCGEKAIGSGYCGRHYAKWRKYGDARKGSDGTFGKSRAPSGSGHLNADGYIQYHMPDHPNAGKNGSILGHRLAMSEILGRPLLEGETVHHKNGKRSDNRKSNLELRVSYHPHGQTPQDLLDWAYEIIERYA